MIAFIPQAYAAGSRFRQPLRCAAILLLLTVAACDLSTEPIASGRAESAGPPVSPPIAPHQANVRVPEGLTDGWNEIATGGDTICSRGTPYSFWVRPGSVNKVIVDFIGGGACWNDTTCSLADAIFNPTVDNVREAVADGVPKGIYDHERADNPFADWYHVVIPYCTGDIHWGDNVVEYASGTINHKGAVNTQAVLDWIYQGFSGPSHVFVTGCSAGSYGSVMWSPHIAEHYPDASVLQFGDSGAGIITQDFFEQSFPQWNAEGSFPSWIEGLDPANVNLLDLELGDLYVGLANHYPQHQFSQYNTAFDENQVFYFQAMGGGNASDWSQLMHASIGSIHARADRFSSFIAPGEQHCIILFDNFYSVNVENRRLVDWLAELVDGDRVENVACIASACDAPTP